MSSVDDTDAKTRDEARQAKMDTLVGAVLLDGVIVSVVLIVAGVIWHWIKWGELDITYTIPPTDLFGLVTTELRELAAGQLRPRLLVSLGIVALLLTPYLRVLVSLLFFTLAAHNWKYSLFTGFVLVVLTYSLFLR